MPRPVLTLDHQTVKKLLAAQQNKTQPTQCCPPKSPKPTRPRPAGPVQRETVLHPDHYTPNTSDPLQQVAVIVTCHNYGHYLEECLESVLAQKHPASEILVVDDASDDDTKRVARRYQSMGVRYLRVEFRDVHKTRYHGLLNTVSEIVCYLDADNKLPVNYLSKAVELFSKDLDLGYLYPELVYFGKYQAKTDFPDEYDHSLHSSRNYVDTGGLVRRQALILSGVYDICHTDKSLMNSHEDWYSSLKISNHRWKFQKHPSYLLYRSHDNQMSGPNERRPYYTKRALAHETVTLFIPLSGRLDIWREHLAPFLDRQTWPKSQIKLHLLDSSHGQQAGNFRRAVQAWLVKSGYTDYRYQQLKVTHLPDLADKDRRNRNIERAGNIALCKIYNELAKSVTTDFAWILEDDIIPPDNCLEMLLRDLDWNIGAVTAAYQSRYEPDTWICWDHDRNALKHPHGPRNTKKKRKKGTTEPRRSKKPLMPQEIWGCGFGCVLLRSELLKEHVFQIPPGQKYYDPVFFDRLDRKWLRLVDWRLECQHLSPKMV